MERLEVEYSTQLHEIEKRGMPLGLEETYLELEESKKLAKEEKIKREYAENVIKMLYQKIKEMEEKLKGEITLRKYSKNLLLTLLEYPLETENRVENIFGIREMTYEQIAYKDEAVEFLRSIQLISHKIKKEKKLSDDDIDKLIEIDRFAEENNLPNLHESVAKIIGEFEKTISAEEIELKVGEYKELEDDVLMRRRKDGMLELIIL